MSPPPKSILINTLHAKVLRNHSECFHFEALFCLGSRFFAEQFLDSLYATTTLHEAATGH
jgi:hypothetical protein